MRATYFWGGLVSFLFCACSSYYQKNQLFNQSFQQNRLQEALSALNHTKKNRFLYYVNKGLTLSRLQRYEESNNYLEKAYLFGEDYTNNYAEVIASYLLNPTIQTYPGEDHEHLMVLYYKAINYAMLDQVEQSLIECKRLNLRLQQLSDKYSSPHRYQKDAMGHILMGLIYEQDKDYNNAFIAYKNGWDIYQNEYLKLFDIQAPEQLQIDILRTAYLSGFREEYEEFKKTFKKLNFNLPDEKTKKGEVVLFWHNGLAPVKIEVALNFVADIKNDQILFIGQEDNELSFQLPISNYSEEDQLHLKNISLVRIAYPKYVRRSSYFQSAWVESENQTFSLQKIEDISQIAIHCLQQRMALEITQSLIRVTLKKIVEAQVHKKNEDIGAFVGVLNMATEHADTRSWQVLPSMISYCRVLLPEGEHTLKLFLKAHDGEHKKEQQITCQVEEGKIHFKVITSPKIDYFFVDG